MLNIQALAVICALFFVAASFTQHALYQSAHLLLEDLLSPLLQRPLLLVGVINDVLAAHQQLALHGLRHTTNRDVGRRLLKAHEHIF